MPSTTTTESISFDASLGQNITTTTEEAFDGYPTPPGDAYDVTQSYTGGKYVVTYKQMSGDYGSNVEIQSSCSTEPLITHPMFADLSEESKVDIVAAEQNPSDPEVGWKALYDASGSNDPMQWYAGYKLWGVDSYYMASIMVRVTKVESSAVDLSQIGKIATPSGATLPNLPSGVTFLLIGADSKAISATRWRNTYEYKGSGPRGWDTGLYGDNGNGSSDGSI